MKKNQKSNIKYQKFTNNRLNKMGLAPLEITRPWASVKSLMGFSFMELMVVVAIMGILIIASMPVFRNFTRGRNIKRGY